MKFEDLDLEDQFKACFGVAGSEKFECACGKFHVCLPDELLNSEFGDEKKYVTEIKNKQN